MSEKDDDTVILVIEGVSINCNKAELSSESEYFAVMFTRNFIEKDKNTITLEGALLKDFLTTLDVVKNKQKPIACTDCNEVISILNTADRFLFTTAVKKCLESLEQLLSTENALDVWQILERVKPEKLLVRARYLALTEFETVRKTASFRRLDTVWLFRYLANTSLLPDKEFNVFEAGMECLMANPEDSLDKKLPYTLLTCLDFHNLSDSDIKEIQNNDLIKKSQNLCAVLEYIIHTRTKNTSYVYASDVIDKAKVLLNTKYRAKDGLPAIVCRSDDDGEVHNKPLVEFKGACVLVESTSIVFFFDDTDFTLVRARKSTINSFIPAFGQSAFGYKQYTFFCGGELRIGSEKWVRNLYVFDAIKEKLRIKSSMPFVRRHFKLVICGKIAYFLGGYGEYRTSKSNRMFCYYYDINKWSDEEPLPFCMQEDKVLCSNLDGQLFVMVVNDVKHLRGYLYSEETCAWKNILINLNGNEFIHANAALFYYSNSLFIKGTKLIELKLVNDELTEIRTEEIEVISDYFLRDCCLCNDTLYSVYEGMSTEKDMKLEVFSMVTRTPTIIPVTQKPHYIFSFRPTSICKTEEYISEYFKIDS